MNKDVKILVVSHNAFSANSNNGKTLKSLFLDYNKGNIAQLFFSKNENPDFNFCDKYFQLTDTDVFRNMFSIKRKFGRRLSLDNSSYNQHNSKNKIKNYIWKYLQSISHNIITLRDFLWKSKLWQTKSLFDWIEGFNPNLIFYCGGNSGFSHEIAIFLKEKYNIPLATYFTDDYIINPISKNVIDRIHRKRLIKIYSKTVENSSLLFAIGSKMVEEYSLFFETNFHPIMNSVSSELFDYYRGLRESNSSLIKISYFGGLHLERWRMINLLANVINNNMSLFSKKIEFRVFTNSDINESIKNKFKLNNIIIEKPIEGDKLIKEMVDTDILLHVESDDEFYKSLTKLSVSTKIPEYLLTRNCVLAFGPFDVASIQLLNDNDIAMVIYSTDNESLILDKLSSIIENENRRIILGDKGYIYARENFDAEKTRVFFMKIIDKVLNA